MAAVRAETGTGVQTDLVTLFDAAFTAQRDLEKNLTRIPAAALVGRPSTQEVVVAFPARLGGRNPRRTVVQQPRHVPPRNP